MFEQQKVIVRLYDPPKGNFLADVQMGSIGQWHHVPYKPMR
jgi:hypothetical protein